MCRIKWNSFSVSLEIVQEGNFEDPDVYGMIIFIYFQEVNQWRSGLD
jgi:hypothetical protein